MTLKIFLQNAFILITPTVANFADIIKIATMFITKIFKSLKLFVKIQSISLFLDIPKFADF